MKARIDTEQTVYIAVARFPHSRRQWAAVEERYEAHPSKPLCLLSRCAETTARVVPVTFSGTSGGLGGSFSHPRDCLHQLHGTHTPRMEANQVAMISRPCPSMSCGNVQSATRLGGENGVGALIDT